MMLPLYRLWIRSCIDRGAEFPRQLQHAIAREPSLQVYVHRYRQMIARLRDEADLFVATSHVEATGELHRNVKVARLRPRMQVGLGLAALAATVLLVVSRLPPHESSNPQARDAENLRLLLTATSSAVDEGKRTANQLALVFIEPVTDLKSKFANVGIEQTGLGFEQYLQNSAKQFADWAMQAQTESDSTADPLRD